MVGALRGKVDRRQHGLRPRRSMRMARDSLVLVAKLLRVDETIWSDLAIVGTKVELEIRPIHPGENASPWLDLTSDELHLHALRRQPSGEMVWVGPHLKHLLHRNVE